jgi:hypothetical protein
MKSIAICYWGLTRSTKKVFLSHHERLFHILKQHNIQYTIYIHTWKTEDNYIWSEKPQIPIDYEEYKLLHPNYYEIDNQDDFLKSITFSDYFNEELYNRYGQTPEGDWIPQLIRNHLCALESQKRVTNMVLNSNNTYNYVMYIRPDVMIENQFDINYLSLLSNNTNSIVIPNYDHFEGYNDKFAIINYNDCSKYGNRIDEIIYFRQHYGRITSEKFVKFIIDKYFQHIFTIDFYFTIIRP